MDEQELIQIVLDFSREMNALETTFTLSDFLGPKYPQFRARREAIKARYLTPRKAQSYIGGFHVPPFFQNISETSVITVEPGKKRRVVEVLTEGFGSDFRFALVYRNGAWRIDSLKRRHHAECGATEQDKWVYATF